MVRCPVEVHRGLIAVEVVEDRGQCLAAVEYLRGFGALSVHVDDKVGVLGEEGLLSLRVAAISAVRVGVDELADRQAVSLLGRCGFSVDHHVSRLSLCAHRGRVDV
jgi:hypothetical protein